MNLILINNENCLSTAQIAEGFGRRHEQIVRLVRKYALDFKQFGSLILSRKIYGKGRPLQGFYLNYGQVMLLASLLKTSKAALEFKKLLCQAFSGKVELLQKSKLPWKILISATLSAVMFMPLKIKTVILK